MVKSLIKTETEYETTLARIEALMDAKQGSDEERELELLSFLVEHYEEEKFPMDLPSPIAAIKFRMEQMGLKQVDLVPLIGSRALVSEILSGKRNLTVKIIQNLHSIGIPYEALLNQEGQMQERLKIGQFSS